MLFRLILVAFLALQGCGSPRGGGSIRIGIDSTWYPIDFGTQTAYVNGFVEELLLEIAKNSGIELERVSANGDSLYEEMKRGRYDAVLSALPPYDFNLAKYDFSENFLELGPVLIVPLASRAGSLQDMKGKIVGTIDGDAAIELLQPCPEVIPRGSYASIPELLNAVASSEIDGALLDLVPAASYLTDLFAGRLKMGTAPLNSSGLHLVTLKDKHGWFLAQFNRTLQQMKKKERLDPILQKWTLL